MRDAYIVKKSVLRNPLKPTELIEHEEFIRLVENEDKLSWYDDTTFGERMLKRYPKIKRKVSAYLNLDEADPKSFVQVNFGIKSRTITVYFEHKSTKQNLHDLIDIADKIDCKLWQFKPKRQILTHEIVNNRYKRTKPTRKLNTEIKFPERWFYFEGNFETFQKVFKPKIEELNATIARINNNNIANNKIVILRLGNNKFFVTGKGIKYLYELEFHPEKASELQEKFKVKLNALFENVCMSEMERSLELVKLEEILKSHIDEKLSTKSEVMVGTVIKRLF